MYTKKDQNEKALIDVDFENEEVMKKALLDEMSLAEQDFENKISQISNKYQH